MLCKFDSGIKDLFFPVMLPAILAFILLTGFDEQKSKSANTKNFAPNCFAAGAGGAAEPNMLSEEEMIEFAKNDHIALLKAAMANYEKRVYDYTGIFYKQERIAGKLHKQQWIRFKFRQEPFSVSMRWLKNPEAADKLLYVHGKNKNKIIVHPTGMLSWMKSTKRKPDSKDVLESSLYPCTKFGFYRNMENALGIYETAKQNGDLTIRSLPQSWVDKRPCWQIERILPQKKEYPFKRLVVKIDKEYLVPVSLESYDWNNRLHFRYAFMDLKFNVGLKDKDFSRKTNGL